MQVNLPSEIQVVPEEIVADEMESDDRSVEETVELEPNEVVGPMINPATVSERDAVIEQIPNALEGPTCMRQVTRSGRESRRRQDPDYEYY